VKIWVHPLWREAVSHDTNTKKHTHYFFIPKKDLARLAEPRAEKSGVTA
jgi:hypothetical protein